MKKNLFLLLLLLLTFLSSLNSISCEEKQVYIVYFGEHNGDKTHQEILQSHHSYLFSLKKTEEDAKASLLYSYKNSINGFAAVLTPQEASILSSKDEVVSVFESKPHTWSLQTTRSWKFVGLDEEDGERVVSSHGESGGNLLHRAKFGKDIIVGVLDSGVWPESRSFNDEDMGPVPKSWKGICQAGDSFNSSHCNRKLIGARYYLKAYEHYNGPLNTSNDYRSPRDRDGHGTHTSSTVGGRVVPGVSALGGFANGTASGGAPLVRLAMYKVCWPNKGSTLLNGDNCLEADMLAAIDDAIGDGVDVISISIGSSTPFPLKDDGIAVGALHAVKRNIVVSCAAGNRGPDAGTVSNLAPWVITVGASSIDRVFSSPVVLGNGLQIKGQTVTPYKLKKRMYHLVYAGDVVNSNVPKNSSAGQCLPGSLSRKMTKGKIVLCLRGEGLRVGKGDEVKRAGGAGFILGNSPPNGNEITVDPHVIPATAVGAEDAATILKYIQSTKKPLARIEPAKTVLDTKPAPYMASFSSTGPNPLVPNILKPDITAPGLNILAAWTEGMSPTKLESDHRIVKYSFDSGTSMACPHVSAVAALLKAVHPDWSSAAIRSALMTTSTVENNMGTHLTTAAGAQANPFNYGSGHVLPTKAADPGLVYDASYTDYLLFLCTTGIKDIDQSFKCPLKPPAVHDLNYPSIAVANVTGKVTVRRTVTNVGGKHSKYMASVDAPSGFSVQVYPKVLHFKRVGEKKKFYVTLRATDRRKSGEYSFGSYTWNDGVHSVRSPIAISQA